MKTEKINKKNGEQDVALATLKADFKSLKHETRQYYKSFIRFKTNDFVHLNNRVWGILIAVIFSILVPIFIRVFF